MDWIEGVIGTVSEGVEIVTGLLIENGIEGIQIEDDYEMRLFLENNKMHWDYADEELLNKEKGAAHVKFYVAADAMGNETLLSVESGLAVLRQTDFGFNLGELSLCLTNVDDKDWLDNWKKYYKPFLIGEKIIIKPIWEDYEPTDGQIVFHVNPGHVFGTGLHQSTQLCIAELEKRVKQGDHIIDLGCGSGILSIISLLLKADYALAVDLDPAAVDIAYENAENNGIDRKKYKVISGNILTDKKMLEQIAEKRYDIVVANIIADVIIKLSAIAPDFIKQDGLFISSGIIRQRLAEVIDALEQSGFEVLDKIYKDEWVCVVAAKK